MNNEKEGKWLECINVSRDQGKMRSFERVLSMRSSLNSGIKSPYSFMSFTRWPFRRCPSCAFSEAQIFARAA
jgi:hypothetical protein